MIPQWKDECGSESFVSLAKGVEFRAHPHDGRGQIMLLSRDGAPMDGWRVVEDKFRSVRTFRLQRLSSVPEPGVVNEKVEAW
jgi:hypothetical protein